MRTWEELENLAWQASSFSAPATSRLLAALKRLLQNRTHEQIEYAIRLIDENIEYYFQEEEDTAIRELKEALHFDDSLHNLFEWDYSDGEVNCYPTHRAIEYIQETSYLETEENTEDYEALLGYVERYGIDDEDDELPNVKEFELVAVLALKHFENAMSGFCPQTVEDEASDIDFPIPLQEWKEFHRKNAVSDLLRAWNILRIAEYDFMSSQRDEELKKLIKEVKETTVTNLQPTVLFRQGKSVIDPAQYAPIELIASYMRNHPTAKVEIRGYASPEGNAEFNQKLSTARAEAVKKALVKKYRIAASRLTTKGMGVTDTLFEEVSFNRVATFNDNAK